MMKDIKNCFKLLKYGYQAKTNAVCGLLFFAAGIFFIMVGYEQLALCCVYLFLAIIFVTQSLYMMLFSEFVAASPNRKRVEFLYMDILNVLGGIVSSVSTLLLAFLAKPDKLEGTSMESLLVVCGLMAIVLYCYMSFAFKSMFLGMVVFIISFLFIMNISSNRIGLLLTNVLEGKTAMAVVIFLVEVVVGIVMGHLIRKIMYRKSMSKWAAGAKLRMEQS